MILTHRSARIGVLVTPAKRGRGKTAKALNDQTHAEKRASPKISLLPSSLWHYEQNTFCRLNQGNALAWQCKMNAARLKELNIKGIAPSVPNHGNSDIFSGRTIVQFPLDLGTILAAEEVDEFIVEGASFGTAHAMAIAWHFGPGRCKAMGLMVPYLSDAICKEFHLESKADALPRTDARTWYQAWNFYVADLMFASPLAPMAKFLDKFPEGKIAREIKPWAIDDIVEDQKERLVARGTQGQGWEQFSFNVTVLWGFDPREIKTTNIAVWYAQDDSMVPASHGEWLVNYFSDKTDVKIDVRNEKNGLGHSTYFPQYGSAYQSSERTMTQTLLELCERI